MLVKLKEIMNIESVITKHTDKLKKLAEKDIRELSISDMAFIKGVSAGSITAMKKNGALNEQILCTEQRRSTEGNKMKIKSYLRHLSKAEMMALLDSMKD